MASYVDDMNKNVFLVVYTNSAVNDLHRLGFSGIIKPDPEKLLEFVKWIDDNLREVIVIKRSNEMDLLSNKDLHKRKLHLTINYEGQHISEEKIEEISSEMKHREKNYLLNKEKRNRQEKVWIDDENIEKNP